MYMHYVLRNIHTNFVLYMYIHVHVCTHIIMLYVGNIYYNYTCTYMYVLYI